MAKKCQSSVTPVFLPFRKNQAASGHRLYLAPASIQMLKKYAIALLGGSLAPVQLGVGAPGGCSPRRFVATCQTSWYKLDFSAARNCVQRDVVLAVIANILLDIYRFCHVTYQQTSILKYGQQAIDSQ
jgi:hypothetical protein